MTVFDVAFKFVMFLFPGVITYLLLAYATGNHLFDEWSSIVYITVYSVIDFLVGNLGLWALNLFRENKFSYANISSALLESSSQLPQEAVIAGSIAAVIVFIGIAKIRESNIFFSLLCKLGISHKVDNSEVWDTVFDKDLWIVLRDLVTGNTYYGCVTQYSDMGQRRE